MNIKSICKHGHRREPGTGKPCVECRRKRTSQWMKKHPEVGRKASNKWRIKHHEKFLLGMKEKHLRDYGISSEILEKALIRQDYKCIGCLCDLKPKKESPKRYACIDHDHVSGRFRAVLCSNCNWILGLAKERVSVLRKLMAYLDYDRTKLHIYLIGALKNPRIPEIGNLLRKQGYDVMDEWFTPGEFADINWQKYEKARGRSYKEALRGRAATNIFLFDKSYLELADIVIFVAPAGKSAMIELGYAKGLKKKTYIFLDGQEPEKYDVMPGFVDDVIEKEDLLITKLEEIRHLYEETPKTSRSYLRD